MCDESRSNDYAHEKGVTREEIIVRYTDWARRGNYEKDLGEKFYKGPLYVVDHMVKLFPDIFQRCNLRILDVAAGTGFVGEKLSALGFENIDALEPSIGMVDCLKTKDVYNHVFTIPLGAEQVPIAADSYEVLIVCGGMGENHIPCAGLDQMNRLVKAGGLVVIMMREAYLTTVEEYKDRLEPRMKALEASNQWTMLSRTVLPRYSFKNNGILYTFRVLKL